MSRFLKSLFSRKPILPGRPQNTIHKVSSGPKSETAYIIGDVHGCLKELTQLLGVIEKDFAGDPSHPAKLVFLGDLIDRGPQSREVVEFLRTYSQALFQPVFLMGNHEEVFLKILGGRTDLLEPWFSFGGDACARSYGVTNLGAVYAEPQTIFDQLRAKVDPAHIDFLKSFRDIWAFGDFVCVHAGIRPLTALQAQKTHDLRWIRSEFLDFKGDHGAVIVHGHTVVEEAKHYGNRIALDTGVYQSGKLSALKIFERSLSIVDSYGQLKTIQT
ncbi:metallophosphoesterase family protein [Parvularcula sp. IMCC14364]|uniref:metallophosphoesterase family protein n=1 Tax=Parvularcula sp. IMCC14364 TaxID=3067902 RepID=UPI00274048A8|nr:metallophosphoesterase family protein [Parvularcula sp. IMCC14364]